MHPSAVLLLWLLTLILIQGLPALGLGLLALALILYFLSLRPAQLPAWLQYLRRSRWLLLSLWLILAYHTPGDALWDLDVLPTEQGLAEASLHAGRLVLMLGLLAALFGQLGRDGLVAALWGLCLPWRRWGVDSERFVVRLALVLDHWRTPHAATDWRRILRGEAPPLEGPASIRVELPNWAARDSLCCLLGVALCLGVMGVPG